MIAKSPLWKQVLLLSLYIWPLPQHCRPRKNESWVLRTTLTGKVAGLELPADLKLARTSDPTLASCLLPDMRRNKCGSYQPTGYWNTPTNSCVLSFAFFRKKSIEIQAKWSNAKFSHCLCNALKHLFQLQSDLTLFQVRQSGANNL